MLKDKVEGYMLIETGVGSKIAYNYSTLNTETEQRESNKRGEFFVMDDEVQEHLDFIKKYIESKKINKYKNN